MSECRVYQKPNAADWASLVDELWLYISAFLTPADICMLLATCHRLQRILAHESALWGFQRNKHEGATQTPHRVWVRLGPHTYTRDKDVPFKPALNHATLPSGIEQVKLCSGRNRTVYARKNVLISWLEKDREEARLTEEVRILYRCRHSHVVKVFDSSFFDYKNNYQCPPFALVMELADGNLDDYLQSRKPRKQIVRISEWFGCLVGVTAHIHKLGIHLKSIQPSNILIKHGRVLLTNFGTCPYARDRKTDYCAPEIENAHRRTSDFGSIGDYDCCKVENGTSCGKSADIFSLGAVFLEMIIAINVSSDSNTEGRMTLEDVLTAQSTRKRSYARSIDHLVELVRNLEQGPQPNEKVGHVLPYCRKMLCRWPDQRPLAEDFASTLLNNGSLLSCKCVPLDTDDES